jgi:hypothetical protein
MPGVCERDRNIALRMNYLDNLVLAVSVSICLVFSVSIKLAGTRHFGYLSSVRCSRPTSIFLIIARARAGRVQFM